MNPVITGEKQSLSPSQRRERHEERLKKIQALLLNKVENCDWHHFEIDLNRAAAQPLAWKTEQRADILDLMIQEVGDSGKYELRSETGEALSSLTREGQESQQKVMEELILGWILNYLKDGDTSIRDIIRRIFDTNDTGIHNNSEADEGDLGIFNEKDRKRRNKQFFNAMNKGFRKPENPQNVVILAEGDSWFEFPRVSLKKIRMPFIKWDPVRDIVDQLMDVPRLIKGRKSAHNLNPKGREFAIKSLAAGGDWLSNMIHGAEYIEELRAVSPDVFLFSGGGNDLLGDNRLAALVRDRNHEGQLQIDADKLENNPDRYIRALLAKRLTQRNRPHFEREKYLRGLSWLRKDFFQVLSLSMAQYFLLVSEITNLDKYKNLLMITQGYDAPIPSNKKGPWWNPLKWIVNKSLDSGKWLYQPLMMKGVTDPEDQKAIIYTMIFEFNEMLIQLAEYQHFPNFFHIDCRGVGKEENAWFDEIHLKNSYNADIAYTFFKCIDENMPEKNPSGSRTLKPKQKVYRVLDYPRD
ncbi:MAG: hypothetical protein AAFR61_10305 [Bacteroidota bacterium]